MFWILHVLSVLAFGIGIAFILFWFYKTLSAPQLWKWGWILVLVGTILCIFAFATLAVHGGNSKGGFRGMMNYGSGFDGSNRWMPMMGAGNYQFNNGDTAAQAKEEAEGKSLYEKLQSKQSKCADLSDGDFELIGEYFMSTQVGTDHLRMNAMMKQVMGNEGEEQMHAIMGKRMANCL